MRRKGCRGPDPQSEYWIGRSEAGQALSYQLFDYAADLPQFKRFGYPSCYADYLVFMQFFLLTLGGHKNDGDTVEPVVVPDSPDHLDAVHLGHVQIRNY